MKAGLGAAPLEPRHHWSRSYCTSRQDANAPDDQCIAGGADMLENNWHLLLLVGAESDARIAEIQVVWFGLLNGGIPRYLKE